MWMVLCLNSRRECMLVLVSPKADRPKSVCNAAELSRCTKLLTNSAQPESGFWQLDGGVSVCEDVIKINDSIPLRASCTQVAVSIVGKEHNSRNNPIEVCKQSHHSTNYSTAAIIRLFSHLSHSSHHPPSSATLRILPNIKGQNAF